MYIYILCCSGVTYKMKYWQEYYYLAKRIEKHFGEINISDLDKCSKTWHTYIIIGGLNIGGFYIKSLIAKVYSSSISLLKRYFLSKKYHMGRKLYGS